MIDDALFEEVVSIRRDIHQFPEIEFDVERTAGIAAKQLRECGIEVKTNVGRSGVVGDIHVPGATRRIALRADMDALPMQEEGSCPYKSKIAGKAHMCGHDAHTAMLIGAAKLLSQDARKLKSHVRFIFQPSEEKYPGGAPGMIADGVLDGVDEIFALHMWPMLPVGTVGMCQGAALAQADAFNISIHGKGGHAAQPQITIDPIVIASHLVVMLQTIVARNVDPTDAAVLTITQFHSGSAGNVIPSTASLQGTVRTYSKEVQTKVRARLEEIIEHVTKSFGATYEFSYQEGYPVLFNHKSSEHFVLKTAQTFLPGQQIRYPAEKFLFGEDFAYYTEKIPGCFIQLGCRNEQKDCIYPLHHPRFNLDEESMKYGIKLLTELAYNFSESSTLLHKLPSESISESSQASGL
jgi:amidohydrolase